jgi:predicted metalloprotease
MRWSSSGKSKNLEDRRAGGVPRGAMIGGGGGLIALVLALVFGIPTGGGGPVAPQQAPDAPLQTTPEEEKLVDFIGWVLDDVQTTWQGEFKRQQRAYRDAQLVVFRDQVESACGIQGAAVGPFYCPADLKAYIDLGFYQMLHERFKAPGDFAQAYVIAHEIGHHVQNLLGTSNEIHRQQQANPAAANDLSVRLELQADCYAGVWAHHTNKRGHLEMGDKEEGLKAASSIGDDALQKGAGQAVRPESFTHGTSAQRMRWFDKGFAAGREEDCDTFSLRDL